ncbi:MAG: hypothetical protein Fur0032_00290 [Terrimicrobiaceae bacterium]
MPWKQIRWTTLARPPGWARFLLFLGLVAIGWQMPGWLKPAPFALAAIVFFWLLPALHRGLASGTDLALRGLQISNRWLGRRGHSLWPWVAGLVAVCTLGLAVCKAAPTWAFLATSSLREDETLNVEQYTSRNFARAVSSYDRARNHILYNIINSIVPGGDSTWPPRARALSILSTASGILLLFGYSALRGWLIPGALIASWLFMNQLLLRSLLEARGYGLLFLISTAACIALAEWLRTRREFWLGTLVTLTVAGAYTLPYFLIFGGGILLALFIRSPSRETFRAGALAAACILLLYLPLASSLVRVALGYGKDYADSSTNNFSSLHALDKVIQFVVPHGLSSLGNAWVPGLLAVAILAMVSRKLIPAWQRETVGLVLFGVVATVCFFFLVGSVPMRSATFLAGPLGFLAVSTTGGWLNARPVGAWRGPLATACSVIILALVLLTRLHEPLIPRQDWRNIGLVIERALPADTKVWVDPDYDEVLQWNRPGRPKTAGDELSPRRFLGGNFAAVDAQIHNWAADQRPGWHQLPGGIRFVTFPLLINFQRLFFLPPEQRGIHEVTWNGEPIPYQSVGSQTPDLSLLENSSGNPKNDPLVFSPPPTPPASPRLLRGPGDLLVSMDAPPRGPWCNFLFSPHLPAHGLTSEWEDAQGRWRPLDRPLHVGEFLGLRIPPSATRIRIRVPETKKSFALLEAWLQGQPPASR